MSPETETIGDFALGKRSQNLFMPAVAKSPPNSG
jgi:hypothetical protein